MCNPELFVCYNFKILCTKREILYDFDMKKKKKWFGNVYQQDF